MNAENKKRKGRAVIRFKRLRCLFVTGRSGYIMFWTVCVFLITALLSAIAVSAALASTQGAGMEYNTRQAYYTAKSAVSATASYIIANSSDTALIESLMAAEGSGSIENMGSYTVNVSYTGTDRIRILGKAVYSGAEAAVSVNLIKPPLSGILPTDNVVYLNGSASSGIDQCTLNGDIYIEGDLTLSYGSAISGFVAVKGTTVISGAGNSTNGLFSSGSVYLDNGGAVNGELLTKGDIKMLGTSVVTGDLTADGSLDMSSGSSVISGNAVIGGNAVFDGGGNRIGGTLEYGGSIICGWGSIASFVPGGAVHITDYEMIDDSPYLSPPLPIITAPLPEEMPELYMQLTLDGYSIRSSGMIDSAAVSQLNSMPYGTTVGVDTSAGDISLLLSDTLLSLSNGLNLEVEGPGNVFIYLTGTSAIYVNSNEYIGMQIRGTNPRLFIFGDGQQLIKLDNNSELNACVYMPEGELAVSGSALDTYKFVGSCTVKTAVISNDVSFFYSSSSLEGTPLEILVTGLEEFLPRLWRIVSWDNR